MTDIFSYSAFTHRNIGFVSEQEQQQLRASAVLVCGVGGMGGACVQSLARAGVGQLALADFDAFDVTNLNRQVFANLDTVGQNKVAATVQQLRRINPELVLETFDQRWTEQLGTLLPRYPVVVNGTDDIRASIQLYRKAREHGATVIDAYTSPLPSVVVVSPADPRPEERLQFPSTGKMADTLSPEDCAQCFEREIEYVLTHSRSIQYIDLAVAVELVAGRRKRMSFAPMVITTGNLMAYEAIKLLLNRGPRADYRGYFFNPWAMRIERPRSALTAFVVRRLVRRFLRRLLHG
jgi:molybdopterin-synthase adenylyltransferase